MKKLRPREGIFFAPRTHSKLEGELLALLDFSIQDPFTWIASDWEAV